MASRYGEKLGGWISSNRQATRIFRASRYREMRWMGNFAQASHKDLLGFPMQGEAVDGYLRIGQPHESFRLPYIERSRGWLSSHRAATRFFRASRYREKEGDGYLLIGQPHGSLRRHDIERSWAWVTSHRPATRIFRTPRYRDKQGQGHLRLGQPQGPLGRPDIERSGGWISSHMPATRIVRAS